MLLFLRYVKKYTSILLFRSSSSTALFSSSSSFPFSPKLSHTYLLQCCFPSPNYLSSPNNLAAKSTTIDRPLSFLPTLLSSQSNHKYSQKNTIFPSIPLHNLSSLNNSLIHVSNFLTRHLAIQPNICAPKNSPPPSPSIPSQSLFYPPKPATTPPILTASFPYVISHAHPEMTRSSSQAKVSSRKFDFLGGLSLHHG